MITSCTEASRTGHFQIHADSPVSVAFRAVDIQVAQSNFAHALKDSPSLFICSDPDFVAVIPVHREEPVGQVKMAVVHHAADM